MEQDTAQVKERTSETESTDPAHCMNEGKHKLMNTENGTKDTGLHKVALSGYCCPKRLAAK